MKRLSALFIILFLVLAGCGAKEPTAVAIERSFSCPVSVEQNGLRYEAVLMATPDQSTAVFSAPEAVKGLSMTYKNGGVTLRYANDPSETSLPDPKLCFLFRLAQALAQTEASCTQKESVHLLRGVLDGENYLLTVDSKTGKPRYFEMDSLNLTVKFQE